MWYTIINKRWMEEMGLTREEFELVRNIEPISYKLTIEDLEDKSDRTLLYGYTSDRYTWHVYVRDYEIVTIVYGFGELVEVIDIEEDKHYVPNKRLYAECCDFEFCSLLAERGVYLPFTTFNDDWEYAQYYGSLLI